MKINSMRIHVLMAEQKLTQATLANSAGVSRVTVNNLLLKGCCSAPTAVKVADALGVTLEEISAEKRFTL